MANSSEGAPTSTVVSNNHSSHSSGHQNKTGNTFFYEDEVFTLDKRGRVKFGIIVCSGMVSDEDDEDYVDPGKVRVAWHPDGKEVVLPVNQVK